MPPPWSQHEFTLRPTKRGCHLVTDQAGIAARLLAFYSYMRPAKPFGCTSGSLACCTVDHYSAVGVQIIKPIMQDLRSYRVGLCHIFRMPFYHLKQSAQHDGRLAAFSRQGLLSEASSTCSSTYLSLSDHQ